MCGIAGLLTQKVPMGQDMVRAAAGMAGALGHRGPDDDGIWSDAAAGIVFGHRRLSIVDLSPAGHQPMVSADGRFVIVYNGEIYTGAEIRSDLPQVVFRGYSDTETIVEACAAWGVERTLQRLVGMFALALWDRQTRTLVLARDRLGIKPLYWARRGETFLFGSELKALQSWPGFSAEIDAGALAAFFRFTYIPAPASIFSGVFKLPPGHIACLRAGAEPVITRYWSLREAACAGASNRFTGTEQEMVSRLHELTSDAVARRLVADVPLGAFLSGGIDSSLVVALMQRAAGRPVRTFTMAFEDRYYDESAHAAAVARHLGTDHTEFVVSASEALQTVPNLAEWYDEPFSDSSQIPTYLVSRLARQHVTVALSGDGGDELFGGYDRYAHTQYLWSRIGWMKPSLRAALSSFGKLLPLSRGLMASRDKACEILECPDAISLFRRTASSWQRPEALVDTFREIDTAFDDVGLSAMLPDLQDRMQYLDGVTHLPDDVLTKVDRASMAVGLEVRVPLLDHRIAEFAFRIPPSMRRRNGRGKWPLRQILKHYVPESLFDRPKMGFMIPLGRWLRVELRDWAESLLSERSLAQDGLLKAAPVRHLWDQHISGAHDWSSQLWSVLMYRSWRHRWAA